MPQPVDTRRLLVSWRPSADPYGARTDDWLRLFKQRMRNQCGSFALLDVRERGEDRAKARERLWTDFMAVFTQDYLDACNDEADHELVAEALHRLRDGVEGQRYWLVRLEAGDPKDSAVGCDDHRCRPWDEYSRWHFMPDLAHDHIDTTKQDCLSTAVQKECVDRLKAHLIDCEICQGSSPAPATAPGGWLARLLRRSCAL